MCERIQVYVSELINHLITMLYVNLSILVVHRFVNTFNFKPLLTTIA